MSTPPRDSPPTGLGAAKHVLTKAYRAYAYDRCPELAAALAYYAVFSLPAVLVIVLSLGGLFVPEGALDGELRRSLGPAGSDALIWARASLVKATSGGKGWGGLALGLVTLVYTATTGLRRFEGALNHAWEVAPNPDRGWLLGEAKRRAVGFGVILLMSLLVLGSLSVSAAVAVISRHFHSVLPVTFSAPFWWAATYLISMLLLGLLFAMIFRVLPAAYVHRHDALYGGFLTAAMFQTGNSVLGVALGYLDHGSVYGAAGTMALVMVWLNLAASILLMGAELTQTLADFNGRPIAPKPGAVHVQTVRRKVEADGAVVEQTRAGHAEDGQDVAAEHTEGRSPAAAAEASSLEEPPPKPAQEENPFD